MRSLTGKPPSAVAMAGARQSARDMVPKRFSSASQPLGAPGTVTGRAPVSGMVCRPRRWASPRSKAAGARPLPLSAVTWPLAASKTRAKQSPPMPVDIGSTTLSMAAVATAASAALPPAIRMRRPAMAARGWLLATMPCRARTVERREGNWNDFICSCSIVICRDFSLKGDRKIPVEMTCFDLECQGAGELWRATTT